MHLSPHLPAPPVSVLRVGALGVPGPCVGTGLSDCTRDVSTWDDGCRLRGTARLFWAAPQGADGTHSKAQARQSSPPWKPFHPPPRLRPPLRLPWPPHREGAAAAAAAVGRRTRQAQLRLHSKGQCAQWMLDPAALLLAPHTDTSSSCCCQPSDCLPATAATTAMTAPTMTPVLLLPPPSPPGGGGGGLGGAGVCTLRDSRMVPLVVLNRKSVLQTGMPRESPARI